MSTDSSNTVITSACADITARLFTGAHVPPTRIGFVYSHGTASSVSLASSLGSSIRSIGDVVTSGSNLNVYLAPFAGSPVTEKSSSDSVHSGNTVRYTAVTSGSTDPSDYAFPSSGYAQFLGSAAAYVYAALLLAPDGEGGWTVVAVRDLRDSAGAGELKAANYDMALTWRITFN